jgi:short-subunit dehydrogenase
VYIPVYIHLTLKGHIVNNSKFREKYGSWAIVSGATNGIGRAFVEELILLKFNIVIIGRNQDALNELSKKIERNNLKSSSLNLDLSLPNSIDKVFATTDKLDVGLVVLSAGFGNYGEFVENNLSDNCKMIDLHCKTRMRMCHHYGNIFKTQKRGGIINLSSIVAYQGTMQAANYSAVNAFLQNFNEGIGMELKKYSVDVLSVCPGPVDTGFEKTAKMKFLLSSSAKTVANASIKSLGRKATVFPGILAKVLHYSLHGLLSRRLKVAIYNLAFKLLVKA